MPNHGRTIKSETREEARTTFAFYGFNHTGAFDLEDSERPMFPEIY